MRFDKTSIYDASFLGVILIEGGLFLLPFVGFSGYFRGFCRLFAHILHKKRRKSCTVNLKCLPLHSLNKKHNGAIAQMVEQRTENPCVPGSIPGGTTPPFIMPQYFRVERHFFMPKSFNPTKSYPHSSSPYIVHKWREKCG